MKRFFCSVVCLVFASASSASAGCLNADLEPTRDNTAAVAKATICLVNQERREDGKKPLLTNTKLAKAARGHSRKMATEGFFDHTDPDGTTLLQRVKRSGYLKNTVSYILGENIFVSSGGPYATPEFIVDGWMNSTGHRRNILNRSYREIGAGVIYSSKGVFFTHDFGTATR